MTNHLVAVWAGTFRIVPCPHCGRVQAVARRPTPFAMTCRDCRRPFRVTGRGAEPALPTSPTAHRDHP